jgi:hypothetical protein
LERISRTVRSIASSKPLRRVAEQQVRLVEEDHELGRRQIACLGERLEQLRDEPHQRRGPQLGVLLHRRQLDARDDAAAVGPGRMRSAIANCGSPKNSVPPPVSSATRVRSSTPTVALAKPPMPSSSA